MKKRGLDSLLEALAEAVGQARAYLLKLDGEAVVRPGTWGPAEVLSHLVYWHRAYVEGIESVLTGGPPFGTGETIDELNAKALDEMAGSCVVDLLQEWEDLQNRLEQMAGALPDPGATMQIHHDSTECNLYEPLDELVGHVREHLGDLQEGGAARSL